MATQVPNTRLIRDNALTVTTALPAASGNVTCTALNLGAAPYKPEEIILEIYAPACAANTSTTDTYTYQLFDSADNSTFAAVSPAVQVAVPGVASTGSAAAYFRFGLPVNTRQYVAVKVTATSGTGNNTAQSFILSLLS